MLKNYFKIALRSFWRDKNFSILNLMGLAVGLSSIIMILAYVQYELSYDKHYSNSERVYRIVIKQTDAGNVLSVNVSAGTADALKKEFPEIVTSTYLSKIEYQFKTSEGIIALNAIEGSPDFFKVFNLPFVSGDSHTPLDQPHSMVITRQTAERLFPGINPVGLTITDNFGETLKITAVIKDIPENTHIKADALISNKGSNYTKSVINERSLLLPQYIILKQQTDPNSLVKKFSAIYKKYRFPKEKTLMLQPVTNIHLYSNIFDEPFSNSDIKYIYIFSSAGFLILLIAMINYVNLTTARSVHRTREVGVRKVLGALKKQLIFQFLAESFVFFVMALLIALVLSHLLWPIFSAIIIDNSNNIKLLTAPTLWILAGITILGGLLSGLYPAFFLSQVKPALSLKGVLKFSVNISLRRGLAIFQFIISSTLIIATLVVQLQLQFISNAPLGFNKEQLISIPFGNRYHHNIPAFKNQLNSNTLIKGATVMDWKVGDSFRDLSKKKKDSVIAPGIKRIRVDMDFLSAMQMKLVSGRGFSDQFSGDRINTDTLLYDYKNPIKHDNLYIAKSIILNETAVKELRLNDPINQVLIGHLKGTVIGVVKDINISTFHQKIPPMLFECVPEFGIGHLYVRMSPDNIPNTLRFIEGVWKKFYPEEEFNFTFVDDNLQKNYSAEARLGALCGIFTALAIIIACFGLFGLVSLTVQQRVKEIGVRKVLGASVTNIVSLLSIDFIKTVITAIAIACPAAWLIMDSWLNDFAYRIAIEWWIFALTGVISILIVLTTIGLQTVRAARANPVKSLRTE